MHHRQVLKEGEERTKSVFLSIFKANVVVKYLYTTNGHINIFKTKAAHDKICIKNCQSKK